MRELLNLLKKINTEEVVDDVTFVKNAIEAMDYCFEARLFDEGYSFMKAINSLSF